MITHPKIYSNKYYYYTDEYFEYDIGRVLEYFTNKMLSYDIEFELLDVNEKGFDEENHYRPHYKKFPYANDIIYMGQYDSYFDDVYKLGFYPSHKISFEQAKKITSMFCTHDDYQKLNKHRDVDNPKDWVEYLTFQTSISENIEPYEEATLGGRIIVQFRLNKFYAEFRKQKIEKILKNNSEIF